MEDFWDSLQAKIAKICLDFDKVWQTRNGLLQPNF